MTKTRFAVIALLVGMLGRPAPAQADGAVRVLLGRTFAAPEGEALRLDAYLPLGAGLHPAVVLLHGGSWTRGTRSDVARDGRAFAQNGFAAFAIDYRLAPRHPHPAALHDAQAAVRWIRAHASRYRVDPARIAAFGRSSGGHLAAMLAVAGSGSLVGGSRVRAAVSWSGPMDLESLPGDARQSEGGWLSFVVRRFVGCSGAPCAGALRAASPIAHVDPSDGALLIANSTEEVVPFGQVEAMEEALVRNRVPHRVVEVAGTTHANLESADDERTLQTGWAASLSFLQAWLSADRSAHVAGVREAAEPAGSALRLLGFLAAVGTLAAIPGLGRRALVRQRIGRVRGRGPALDGARLAFLEALAREGADRRGIEAAMASTGRAGT
ncbi:MAG: alpha/beta hydrolase [Actinomycetota bacterium]